MSKDEKNPVSCQYFLFYLYINQDYPEEISQLCMAGIYFKEEQWFRHNLLWTFLLAAPFLSMLAFLFYQVNTGVLVGDHPVSNTSLIILSVCYGIPAGYILLYVKLTTVITDQSILYGWNLPTAELNEIHVNDIRECHVIEYTFVGWGYRLTRKYGAVYNVDGNKGLHIVRKSGRRVLIGTHHVVELKKIIEALRLEHA